MLFIITRSNQIIKSYNTWKAFVKNVKKLGLLDIKFIIRNEDVTLTFKSIIPNRETADLTFTLSHVRSPDNYIEFKLNNVYISSGIKRPEMELLYSNKNDIIVSLDEINFKVTSPATFEKTVFFDLLIGVEWFCKYLQVTDITTDISQSRVPKFSNANKKLWFKEAEKIIARVNAENETDSTEIRNIPMVASAAGAAKKQKLKRKLN